MDNIEEQLRAQHGVRINEQIGDELRRWIAEYYEKTERLPELPTEEAGGSRAMFSRQGKLSIKLYVNVNVMLCKH